MSGLFKIGFINKEEKQALVLSINLLGLELYKNELEQHLKEQTFEGEVLFDLFLNGNNSNRFVQIYFDGDSFIYSTFSVISNVDKQILELSAKFYSDNSHLLEYGCLSKAEKFLIKNGHPLTPKPAAWFVNQFKNQVSFLPE